jgi:hypothetical protein
MEEEDTDNIARYADEMRKLTVYLSTGVYSKDSSKAERKKTFAQSKTHVFESKLLHQFLYFAHVIFESFDYFRLGRNIFQLLFNSVTNCSCSLG